MTTKIVSTVPPRRGHRAPRLHLDDFIPTRLLELIQAEETLEYGLALGGAYRLRRSADEVR